MSISYLGTESPALRRNKSILILILSVFTLAAYLFYSIGATSLVLKAIKEDGFFEWVSALSLFSGGVLAVFCFKKSKSIFYLLISVVMFFGAGEEISWGQRIAGFETPDVIKSQNVQGEFTIHNLSVFNVKQFSAKEKHQGLEKLLEMDNVFKMFVFGFGIILPLATAKIHWCRILANRLRIPIPPLSVGLFFAFAWIGRRVVLSLLYVPGIHETAALKNYWAMLNGASEVYECIDALTLLAIFIYFFSKLKNQQPVSS